jgi:hypothetical protein
VLGCVTCCVGSVGRGFVIAVLGWWTGGWHVPCVAERSHILVQCCEVQRWRDRLVKGKLLITVRIGMGGGNRESSGASLCVMVENRMRKATMPEESRLCVAVVMRVAKDCSECQCTALLDLYRQRGNNFTMTSQLPRVSRA